MDSHKEVPEDSKHPFRFTYAAAGVDNVARERLVPRFAELARQTRRPEVLADVGAFGGMFRLSGYRDPVLVASTDSVGTKVKLGILMGRYEGLGHDVVNQNVNDILTAGAEPLFFLDYIGNYQLAAEHKLALVKGVADACRAVGCALLGGETADMPGIYAPGDFDLAGFIVGAVERDRIIDGSHIQPGDVLLGLPASGLHTNGYSLVRRVFNVGVGGDPEAELAMLNRYYEDLGATLGDALLVPHRAYYNDVQPVLSHLKGIAHITGGGIPGNLPRVLPDGLSAQLERGSWDVPPIFRVIQEHGNIEEGEMYRTFNMGLGLIVVCAEADVAAVQEKLPQACVVGHVIRQEAGERVVIE